MYYHFELNWDIAYRSQVARKFWDIDTIIERFEAKPRQYVVVRFVK